MNNTQTLNFTEGEDYKTLYVELDNGTIGLIELDRTYDGITIDTIVDCLFDGGFRDFKIYQKQTNCGPSILLADSSDYMMC